MTARLADKTRIASNKRGMGIGRGQGETLRGPRIVKEGTIPGGSSGFQSSPAPPKLVHGLPADLHEASFDPFVDEDDFAGETLNVLWRPRTRDQSHQLDKLVVWMPYRPLLKHPRKI